MTAKQLPWAAGSWSTPPSAVRQAGDELVVTAEEGSDFWETTLYGFRHASGHALLAPWDVNTAVEVTFRLAGFTGQYDQAGLMLWRDGTNWIKSGVELNDGVPQVGAVVTSGSSDWSLAPVPDWSGRAVTIRATQRADAVILRAKAGEEPWRTLRVAPFPASDNLTAGPYFCAPTRAGFAVTFTRWAHPAPDTDLHAQPGTPGPAVS